MREQWRDVVGYEGRYRVSSLGRVYSLEKVQTFSKGGKRITKAHFMSLIPGTGGYLRVLLSKNNKKKFRLVHHLVLEAWSGKRPRGKIACHGDGDPANNKRNNLRWDTYQANSADAKRHGTLYNGERHHSARLTAKDVLAIRKRIDVGEAHWHIGKDYGVSSNAVWKIAQNMSWTQVH